ncbi:hypothetical protein BH23CHL2_BH23CHL2_25040 [soil metagenome]
MQPKSTNAQPRALLYTRVSSDAQEERGSSLATQLESCRAYCTDHNHRIIGEFTDTHTGAEYRERPGLSALRELLRAGAVDVVVVHALDRLSRDQTHMAVVVDEIEHHGARLELVTESFEDSAVGKFIRSAKAFAGEVEREKLTERVSRGRRKRAESGKYLPGRKPPYGLVLSDDRTKLEENPAELPIVHRIFADYGKGGTLRGVALALTADGVPTPRQDKTGNPVWDLSTVRWILTNTIYTGTMLSHGGTIELTDIAPVVIDPVTFDAVQRRLKTNRQRSRRNAQYPEDVALLRAGFAVCGLCGGNMMVQHTAGSDKTDYKCRATADNQCRHFTMRTYLLDAEFWDSLRAFLLDDDVLDQTKHTRGKLADPGPELAVIERSLANIERQHANIARRVALTDDDDSAAVLMAQVDQLSQRRRELENERETVAGQVESYQLSRQVIDDLNGWRKRTAESMDVMSFTERRELLETLRIKVQLWPSDHSPRWLATSEIVPSILLNSTKEYPHIDVAERAVDLFQVIAGAAEGKTKPTMAVYNCRMVSVFQTPVQPLRDFIDGYSSLEGRDGVLTITICQGFPYSDLPIGGARMVVVTDDDPEGAERLARKLGKQLFDIREAMQPEYLSIDQALDQAITHDGRPVVIADYADNAGGGAPSDSTFILERMLDRGITNAAFGMIWDPIALDVAMQAGVGANLSLRIGGKMGPTSGRPLDLDVEVIAVVPDAKAVDARLAREIELGDVVGLRSRGIDIILNNDRHQVLSADPFTLCGIDPIERDIVVVKSSQHFYAAYSQIGSKILYAYSDGALNPILRDIPYERLPKDQLWPWNPNPFADGA